MTAPAAIGASTARRFLVLRHLLAPPRALPPEPGSVLRVFDRLGSIQFDPLEVAGRNHDLVLLARVEGYRRAWTDDLLYRDRVLYETYNKMLSLVPTAELPYHRLTWDLDRLAHERGAFDEHAPLVEELLEWIRNNGPLGPGDVAPRAAIQWYWRPTNQVRALLEALAEAGILGLARRDGNRRVYDLIERLFPAELLAVRIPEVDQRRHRLLSRYRAHGLLGASGGMELWYGTGRDARQRTELRAELVDSGVLVPVGVEGLRGPRFVLREELPLLEQAEREVAAGGPPGGRAPGVAFIAPLDPLIWDRALLEPLYGFEYRWEVYVPAPKRRWGYYVLPILYGDRLVGRIEPRIDRASRSLRILGMSWEPGFHPLDGDPAEGDPIAALAAALRAHNTFVGTSRIVLPRVARHRDLVRALRPHLA